MRDSTTPQMMSPVFLVWLPLLLSLAISWFSLSRCCVLFWNKSKNPSSSLLNFVLIFCAQHLLVLWRFNICWARCMTLCKTKDQLRTTYTVKSFQFGGTIFMDCGYFAYLLGCDFMDALVFTFIKKITKLYNVKVNTVLNTGFEI